MLSSREAGELLLAAQADDPLVVTLSGDLGAGKTTFVKAALAQMGYPPSDVQSPTFLKLLEYRVPNFGLCLHIDAYRMQDIEDFDQLALETYAEARAWFVEWPELFLKFLSGRADLKRHLGFRHYWDLEFASRAEEKKVDPILGSGGGGEGQDNPAAWRGIRWHRKSF